MSLEKPVSWRFTEAGQQWCSFCAFRAAHSVTSEGTGGTSGKKENIVVEVTGRGGGLGGETTGKYCLHVVFGSFLPARDSISCACTMLLHRLLGECWDPA